ncbi:MAG: histidinol-phosphate transaminase [Candidatus Aminicenantes bacterium]|nr:histidinol-phosphate transaminase [Candidatus Aminicenantes bacterium]
MTIKAKLKKFQTSSEYSIPDAGSNLIRLNLNESAYPLPERLKEKILSRLKNAAWHLYPSDRNFSLLSRLASYTGHQPDGILLGNGSNELIQTVAYACCSGGDTLATLKPGFSIYKKVAELIDIKVIEIPLKPDLSFNLEKIIEAGQEARVIFLGSPHNPTGQTLSRQQVEEILTQVSSLVVLDEAYAEFSKETSVPLLSSYDNLLILRTFSKAFRLAGARFGYALGQPETIQALQAARLPFSVGLFQQTAAEVLLEEKDYLQDEIQQTIKERERLFNQLQSFKTFQPFPSRANFLLVKSHCLPAKKIFLRLLAKGILVRIFDSPELPELKDKFRITIGQPQENDCLLAVLQDIEKEVLSDQKS